MKKVIGLTLVVCLLPWNVYADNELPEQNNFIIESRKQLQTQIVTDAFNMENRRNSGDALFDIFHQDLTTPKTCQIEGVNILLDNSCHLGNYRLKDNETKEERKPSVYGIRSYGSESVYCRQCKKEPLELALNSTDIESYKSILQASYKEHKTEKWIEKLAQLKKKFKYLKDELTNVKSYNNYDREWALEKIAQLNETEQACAGDKVIEGFKAKLNDIALQRSLDNNYSCSSLSNLQNRFKLGGLNTTKFEDKYYNRSKRREDDNSGSKKGFQKGISEFLNDNFNDISSIYNHKVSFSNFSEKREINSSDYCSQYDTSIDSAFSTHEDETVNLIIKAIKDAGSIENGEKLFSQLYEKQLAKDPRFDDFPTDDVNANYHLAKMTNMWAGDIFAVIKSQPDLVEAFSSSNNLDSHKIKQSYSKSFDLLLREFKDQEALGFRVSVDKLMNDCEKQHSEYIQAIACSNDDLDMTDIEKIAEIDPLVAYCPIINDVNERAKRKPEIEKTIAQYNRKMIAINSEFQEIEEKDLDYRCAAFRAVTCSGKPADDDVSIPEKAKLAEMFNETKYMREQALERQDELNKRNEEALARLGSEDLKKQFAENTKASSCLEIVNKCNRLIGEDKMSLAAMNDCYAKSWSDILRNYNEAPNKSIASLTASAVFRDSSDNVCLENLILEKGEEIVAKMSAIEIEMACSDFMAKAPKDKIIYKTSVNTDPSGGTYKSASFRDNNSDGIEKMTSSGGGLGQGLLKEAGSNALITANSKNANTPDNSKKPTNPEPAYNAPKNEWIDYTKNVVSNLKSEVKELNKDISKLERKKDLSPEETDDLEEKRRQRDLLKQQTKELEEQIANLKNKKDDTKDKMYQDQIDDLKQELADTKKLLKKKNKAESSPQDVANGNADREQSQSKLEDLFTPSNQKVNVVNTNTPTPTPSVGKTNSVFVGNTGTGNSQNGSIIPKSNTGDVGAGGFNADGTRARAGVQVGTKLDTFEDKDLMNNDNAPTLYITSQEQYGNLNVKIDEYLKNPEMCKNGCSPDKPFRIIVTYNPSENTTGKIKQYIKIDPAQSNGKVNRSVASEGFDPKPDLKKHKQKKEKSQSYFEDDLSKEIDKALK